MQKYILRRLLWAIPTLLGVMTCVFLIVHLTPGDPAQVMLGEWATKDAIQELRHNLGLDEPLIVQYVNFIKNYFTFNFGKSYTTNRSVLIEIISRLPHTFLLVGFAAFIALIIGIPVGVIAAVKQNSFWDYILMIFSMIGYASPSFWLGIILILVFSVHLDWLPAIGAGDFSDPLTVVKSLILPACALGLRLAALMVRITRGTMLDVLKSDYVRTARAKGVKEQVVIYKHVLRNAMIPIITVFGLNVGKLLGGTVILETVFARPGLGKLVVDAILKRDFPVVQATTFFIGFMFIFVNLFVDIIYSWINPRIRYE